MNLISFLSDYSSCLIPGREKQSLSTYVMNLSLVEKGYLFRSFDPKGQYAAEFARTETVFKERQSNLVKLVFEELFKSNGWVAKAKKQAVRADAQMRNYSQGDKYVGTYEGEMDGHTRIGWGRMTYANGTFKEGMWVNDELPDDLIFKDGTDEQGGGADEQGGGADEQGGGADEQNDGADEQGAADDAGRGVPGHADGATPLGEGYREATSVSDTVRESNRKRPGAPSAAPSKAACTHPKPTRATNGGSGAMVADPLLETVEALRLHPIAKPPESATPDAAQFPCRPNALTGQLETLAPEHMYTDDESCALDAFNMALGKRLLTRDLVGVPNGPIKFLPESQDDVGKKTPVCMPWIAKAGYQLARVGTKKQPPTFRRVLQQRRGVFLVEFYWRKSDGADWHVVAVNCCQRRVWCNALGVVPFSLKKRGDAFDVLLKESAKTHDAVIEQLHLVNVCRVWQVLRK